MISYADLTDRAAVDWAMDECDRLGRIEFLNHYGFREAREYFLVRNEGKYDSKAIFAAAYEQQHGVPVGWDELHGGKNAAAGRLVELGFEVEGMDDKLERKTFATFDEALEHYRIPMENLPIVREFLTGKHFIEFYIPKSGSYIAAEPEDGLRKAYLSYGHIWHRVAKGKGEQIDLPVNRGRDGGFSRSSRQEQEVQVCPVHFMVLPASGVCPDCQ